MSLKTSAIVSAWVVVAFVGMANSSHAHGGRGSRGGTYTASGPAAYMPGPAAAYYGGYDGVPLAVRTTQTYAIHTPRYAATAPAPARRSVGRVVFRRRGW